MNVTEKWCRYHGDFVYPSNASEHRLASCEIVTVQIPVIDISYEPIGAGAHVHRFEFVDCARPLVCFCGEEQAAL